jgi:hypothetical protein
MEFQYICSVQERNVTWFQLGLEIPYEDWHLTGSGCSIWYLIAQIEVQDGRISESMSEAVRGWLVNVWLSKFLYIFCPAQLDGVLRFTVPLLCDPTLLAVEETRVEWLAVEHMWIRNGNGRRRICSCRKGLSDIFLELKDLHKISSSRHRFEACTSITGDEIITAVLIHSVNQEYL